MEAKKSQPRLVNLLRRVFEFLWYLSLVLMTVWLVAIVIVGVNIPEQVAQRHTDIHFVFDFKVFPEEIISETENKAAQSEMIQGQAEIKLNNTQGYGAWYWSNLIVLMLSSLGVATLYYLKTLFVNLSSSLTLAMENVILLRRIAYLILAGAIAYPFMTYIGGVVILADIGEFYPSVELSPSISFELEAFIIAGAVWVLSEIFREAAELKHEQQLTI